MNGRIVPYLSEGWGRDLRRLLPLKTKAEYEPDGIAPSVATKAIERAQRCAAVARRVAATTR